MINQIYLKIKNLIFFMIIINFNFTTTISAQDCTNNLSPISNFGVQEELNISKNYITENTIIAGQTYVFSFEAKFRANRDNFTKIVGVNFEQNGGFHHEVSEVITTREFHPYEIEFTPKAGFDRVNVFAFKLDNDVSITVRNACLQLKTSTTNPDFCQNNLSPTKGFEITQSSTNRIDIQNTDITTGEKYVLIFDAKINAGSEHKFAGVNFNNSGVWIAEFREDLSTQMENYRIEFTAPSGFNDVNVFAFKSNGNATVTMQNICLVPFDENNGPPVTDEEPTTNNNCLNNENNLKIEDSTTWNGDFLAVGSAIKGNHQYVLNFSARYTAAIEPGIKIAGINFKDGNSSFDFREHITSRDFKQYEIVFTAPSTFSSANTFVWMSQISGQTKVELKDVCLREIPRSSGSTDFNIITLNNYPTPTTNECGMYVGIASPVNSHHIDPRTNFNNTFHNCFNIIVPENGMKMGTLKKGVTHNGVTPVGPDVWNTIPLEQEIGWANSNIPIRGHTLCWHGAIKDETQVPDPSCNLAVETCTSRESKNPDYLKRMSNTDLEIELKNHISDVITLMNDQYTFNGKPRAESWDVVNEALRGNDPDSEHGPFRTFNEIDGDIFVDEVTNEIDNRNMNVNANGIECIWERLGYDSNYSFTNFDGKVRPIPKYIITAFKEAERVVNLREDTKNQALVYNDWGAEFEGSYGNKSEVQFRMIKALKNHPTQPIRIDGIGFQSHFSMKPGAPDQITYDRLQSFKNNIERYTTEWPDIKIYFTEVDITLPDNAEESDIVSQAMYYKLLAQLAASIPQTEAFITWGLIDRLSWVNSDQTRAPLLFRKEGNNYIPKQSYFEVLEALREANCSSSSKLALQGDELEDQLFEVYPIPFNQQFSISSTQASSQLKVYDMTGRLKLEQSIQDGITHINTTDLRAGCYLIELESKGSISRQKVIKH